MPSLNDINFNNLYVMLKGEPGTRKSTAALSFPGPQYWFSADKKMNSLITPMKKWGIDPKTIEYDDYRNWFEIDVKLNKILERCPYKTIIFDSVTSIGDCVNLQTMRLKAQEKKEENKKETNIGGIGVNDWADYKAESSAFTQLIDRTKELQVIRNVNIILIAHVIGQRSSEQVGSTQQARIIVTGGKTISAKIPAYCEEVYHFNAKSSSFAGQAGTYEVITEYTGDDFARTALNLPSRWEMNDKNLYNELLKPAIERAMVK